MKMGWLAAKAEMKKAKKLKKKPESWDAKNFIFNSEEFKE